MSRNVVYHQGAAVVVVPQQHLYGEVGDVNPHARCACNVCILGAIFIAVGIFVVFLIKVQSKMSHFLGTRRESVYIMSLTGIILGIFLMVGSLLLLYDIEKRQQRRVNHRMRRAMLMNDDLSAFERPDFSSDDDDDVTTTSGMNKRCQMLPSSCTASPAGRMATYSTTDPAIGAQVEIHPKYPSRQISPFQSGSRGPLGAYSISGEISPYHSFPEGMARDYLQPPAPSEGQIISCQTFPAANNDSLGHSPQEGAASEAPPAYESQSGVPATEGGASGGPGYLPQYPCPPPYTPYTDDPPPYSP